MLKIAKFTTFRSVKYAFEAKKIFCDNFLIRRSSCTSVPSFKQFHQVRKNKLLNIPVEMLFLWKNCKKFHIILVCKILTDGSMSLKLGKVVHLSTAHLHAKCEIYSSFISENIPIEMLFLWKNGLKFILFWSVKYTSIELCTWNWVRLCTLLLNMYMYTFKSQSHCIVKIFSILWHFTIKSDQKLSAFWSVKYTYYK